MTYHKNYPRINYITNWEIPDEDFMDKWFLTYTVVYPKLEIKEK